MGCTVGAKCLDCGKEFSIDHGGGFFFHLVRCESCGKTKSIGFERLGKLHLRYVKGLPGPYCISSSESDKYIQQNTHVEPICEEDYYKGVETYAGNCKCGGKFTFTASPRCPHCRSLRIEEGTITIMYD